VSLEIDLPEALRLQEARRNVLSVESRPTL
jgi:hypothetical protein